MLVELSGTKTTHIPFNYEPKTRIKFRGFVIKYAGSSYICTCAHNIAGVSIDAEILYRKNMFDVAILKCDTNATHKLTYQIPHSGPIYVPNRRGLHFGNLVGTHIYRTQKYPRLEYKLDISVNFGASGSPVLDAGGTVIGMISRANTYAAYAIPIHTIIHCIKSIAMPNSEFHGPIDYIPYGFGTYITNFGNQNTTGIIQAGDIITHIDNHTIDFSGNIPISIYHGMWVPFWYLLYHKIPGETIGLNIIRSSNAIRHEILVRNIPKQIKLKYMIIGNYIIAPLTYKILDAHNRNSIIALNFIEQNRGRVAIIDAIDIRPEKYQIIIEFNGIRVLDIYHLNYMYQYNTSRIITLTLLNQTQISLNYMDSIRDASEIQNMISD